MREARLSRRRLLPAWASLLFCCVAHPCLAQQPVPIGGEFQVNVATNALISAVAVEATGEFVIVWAERNAVLGRRYDASGRPRGQPFQVGPSGPYTEFASTSVAVGTDGEFIVSWTTWTGPFTNMSDVLARRYDGDGSALGPQFRATEARLHRQTAPVVGIAADGRFAVVWEGVTQGGSYQGVFGRAFDASGNPRGGDFSLSTTPWLTDSEPTVAVQPSGAFVVAWTKSVSSLDREIAVRRFDDIGNPLGSEFRINPPTQRDAWNPAIAVDGSGAFVVTWSAGGSSGDVFGRRFDASGSPASDEFSVNTYTTGLQRRPSVSMSHSGDFVVIWEGYRQDGGILDLFGQSFDALGNKRGTEFRVNSHTDGWQSRGRVAAGPGGTFVATWGNTFPVAARAVFAQRWGPDLIFADGFESGDLSAWSGTQTDGGDLGASAEAALPPTLFGLQASVDDSSGTTSGPASIPTRWSAGARRRTRPSRTAPARSRARSRR